MSLQAAFVDGGSTRIRTVDLSIDGTDLLIRDERSARRVPLAAVHIDERLGSTPRKIRFADGSFCEVRDLDGLDALLVGTAHAAGWLERRRRGLPGAILATLALLVALGAGYRWGLPWAAAFGARHLPPQVGRALAAGTLAALDGGMLRPSRLDPARRRRLEAALHAWRLPDGSPVASAVLFRRSPSLGANAFTLPDGTIIVLDDLVVALDDREVLAVLAHELGHAQGHHGLELLLRSSVVGAFLVLYLGDASQLLSVAPAVLIEARYSQDLEQRADDYGATVLSRNGASPAALADALERLSRLHPELAHGGYLSSHPATEQRVRRLRARAPF